MSNEDSLEQLENIYTNRDQQGIIDALNDAQAVIEFELDGTILTANENFLSATGYEIEEIQDQHHKIFCDEAYTKTTEYKSFWKRFSAGKHCSGEYKRFT